VKPGSQCGLTIQVKAGYMGNMTDTLTTTQGSLSILDHTGDTRIAWSTDRPDEVEAARDLFTKFKGKGYLAYRVEGTGKGSVLREFDPAAGDIIMSPQMQGG